MKITDVDKNFKIESKITRPGLRFYSALGAPFKIYGVFYENGKFRRTPEDVAKSVSQWVYYLHTNTAGGRVRFKTNSPYVAIYAELNEPGKMPHFPLSGSCGFDLYVGEKYKGTFMPPFDVSTSYESVIDLGNKKMRDITINFPLYSGVSALYIGLKEGCEALPPDEYRVEKPVVYYGSSITQGGCASRPGNAYEAIVTQKTGVNHVNLGFSGSAKAEKEISDYICSLDMSAFVFDYDHNAPTTDHLRNTHERMFKEVRESHPTTPIIMLSRPKYTLTREEKERVNIIKATYENALSAGDKNVYFIDGKTLMRHCHNEGTVDNCHPNDWGFYSMAQALTKVIKKIL